LGAGWTGDYWQYIANYQGTGGARVNREDGKIYTFKKNGNVWQASPGVQLTLEELTNAQANRTGWRLTLPDDRVEVYAYDGVSSASLSSITDRAGFTTTLNYNLSVADGGDGNAATLDKVTDPFGRSLLFKFNAAGNVINLVDPAGNIYSYGRDANNRLLSVTYPDNTPGDNTDNPTRIYHYENTGFPNALTGITDENNNRLATWTYDTQGRAISSEHAGGVERVDIVYNVDGTTTVTDSVGNVQTYHFDVIHGVVKTTQVDGDQCADCGQYANTTYDANGFIASRTDFNGNVTTYVRDARGLETSRTEAVGMPQEHTITTQWHPTFRLPVQITEPGQITTFTYDAQGRLLTREIVAQ
jgi:YD repeat-containing protein